MREIDMAEHNYLLVLSVTDTDGKKQTETIPLRGWSKKARFSTYMIKRLFNNTLRWLKKNGYKND